MENSHVRSASETAGRENSEKEKNSLGIIGFALALSGLLCCWIPGWNLLLLVAGLVVSLIAVSRTPRIFAAIGIGVSICTIVLYVIGIILIVNELID